MVEHRLGMLNDFLFNRPKSMSNTVMKKRPLLSGKDIDFSKNLMSCSSSGLFERINLIDVNKDSSAHKLYFAYKF